MKTKLLLIVVALLALSVVACNQNMDDMQEYFDNITANVRELENSLKWQEM